MRTKCCLPLAVFLAWTASGPLWADDAGDARALLAKAIDAAGGEAKLAKAQAMTWKEKGTFHGAGMALPYTATCAVQWPGQARMDIDNFVTIVLNNDQGWLKPAMQDTQTMSKEQLEEHREDQHAGYLTTLLPLKDPAYRLTPLPEAKVGDKAAVGIKVSHPKHRDVRLFFDKQTHLLVKCEQRVKPAEQPGQEVAQDTYYEDYRAVDGVQLPYKVVLKRDGKPYVESEILELKLPGKLPDARFAKP
jgi:hypothetical protein